MTTELYVVGRNYYYEMGELDEIPNLIKCDLNFCKERIMHITSGNDFSIFRGEQQNIWTAGYNLHGQDNINNNY